MRLHWALLCVFLAAACAELQPPAPAASEILDGPIQGLTAAENQQFIRGDAAFNNDVFTAANGLGPLFVATSCGSCHPGDGKGHPFTTLTRFGQSDPTGNQFLKHGGPQLQNRALPGFTPEVIPGGATSSKFTPPANTGLGYIDAVPDADILAWADPNDANGDGISGVPNWVGMKGYITERTSSSTNGSKYVGRFGKKGGAYDLLQQTAQAYNQDIGISSTFEPVDTYSGTEVDPEITDQKINDVVAYLKTLKAPVARTSSADALAGKEMFTAIGCATCHRAEMKTGASNVAALANKTFYPYTDLLLHDMGPALDDGYTEGSALSSEWRTPALWGLGLSGRSQGGEYYLLHDGRARSIAEAITLHGGEATRSKDNFVTLSDGDKKKLIAFLESL
jgi:CxxC motif-containing protein (DUF1111 family)